jgi:sugar phosphate isomerase/epimerase
VNRDAFFARYGVSTYLYEAHPLFEALEKIAAAGFHILELWASQTHLDPRLKPDISATRALMQRLGLEAHSLHAPFWPELHIGDTESSYRFLWGEAIFPSLHYAAELGAKGVVFHVSTIRGENTAERCAEGAKIVVAFVEEELAPLAKQLGVSLLIENMVNYGWPRFGCPMAELAAAFPGPDIRFCIDIGHTQLNKIDPQQDIAAVADRLMSIHCSNNDGRADLHSVPTDGLINWPAVAANLEASGYSDPYILEVKGGDHADQVLERMQRLWRELPD